ncbi:hypothetical protein NEF87_003565 [Candidatus Lokiarchaeum ossiferum]|uniref:DUF2268 domain-containing protein n=1 Tax=Candidatus Lokiarchaeum ossiferum TaxID=2951803 RepID=A0ABY6HUT4_9ARCH|nr:hypothetical protein NEF87_003565 [Candidatus Lokiarchaeum sp. B-35]
MKKSFQIIDVYTHFDQFWQMASNLTDEEYMDAWYSIFMKNHLNLRRKLVHEYEVDGYEWKSIVKNYVFSDLQKNATSFTKIGKQIQEIIPTIHMKCQELFQIEFPINYVIYVGIGMGAGWATSFINEAAVLLGLENILQCGWTSEERLKALVAHEVGHLIHLKERGCKDFKFHNDDLLFSIYEEGMAMWAEHQIMGYNDWHMQEGQDNWVEWCYQHKHILAQKFLQEYRLNEAQTSKNFFGSWFNIEGKSQTGYFLGHEIIKEWLKLLSFKEIALLPEKHIYIKILETLEQF